MSESPSLRGTQLRSNLVIPTGYDREIASLPATLHSRLRLFNDSQEGLFTNLPYLIADNSFIFPGGMELEYVKAS